jgi:hypothetical protein
MYKRTVCTSFLTLLAISVFCQVTAQDKGRHKINESAIYGGLGITPLYGHITVNYEILLAERPDKVFKKRGLRVSTGVYQYYDDGSLNVIINYTCLTGANKNHFELGLGAAYMHFLQIREDT